MGVSQPRSVHTLTTDDLPHRPDLPSAGWSTGPPARRRPGKLLALVPVLALAFVAYAVRLPYFVIGPGPARDVEPLIHVSGTQTFPSQGHLLLTAVTIRQANAYDLFGAWLDPASSVLPERAILAPGETQEQEAQVARSQMDTSKIDAAIVALSGVANYPAEHGQGALVEFVDPGAPADGKLFAGDLIVAVDGATVRGPDDLGTKIEAGGAGKALRFTVKGRPGGTVTVSVVPRFEPKLKRPIIGVRTVQNFPFSLTIESGDIGGPSAGLMWTLGLVDLLTPGDLTGGRKVAGTGEIGPDGKVYPIGGVEEKVVAAERAGAAVFFAPVQDASAARTVAHGMVIVSVKTYRDALRYLQSGS